MRQLRLALVSLVMLVGCLAAAEWGRRVLDGYFVWRLELVKNPNSTDLTWSDGRPTEALLKTIPLDIEVDRSWFYDRPAPRQVVTPEWAVKRLAEFEAPANYVWNAARLTDDSLRDYVQKYRGRLADIFTFRAPNHSRYPFYRLYPNIQTELGITNQFGWRSRPVAEQKPPNVIRIGVIGDSTTSAYPVLVEHWLNRWAERRQLSVRFEVLNAARPASGASDAVGIFDFELSPFNPDYVIVYGFGNGIYQADDLIKLPPGVVKGQPATWKAAANSRLLDRLSREVGTQLVPMTRWSAAADFLRDRIIGHGGGSSRPEPAKPATRIVFPPGVEESSPNLDKIASFSSAQFMQLDGYLQNLNKMDSIAKARNIRLLVSTFRIMAFDGMRATGDVYTSINEQVWWPYTYSQIDRLMAFYNRTLRAWADARGQGIIEVDEHMPRGPELYGDAMHETEAGGALHGWVVLQQLMPRIRDDLARHRVPTAGQPGVSAKEYWAIERTSIEKVEAKAVVTSLASAAPSLPSGLADDISDAFPLSKTHLAYERAEIVPGHVPLIRTGPEPFGYAAAIPFEPPSGVPTGSGWVIVRIRIKQGGITVGVLNKSSRTFLTSASLEQAPDIQEARLPIDDLSDIGSLVISNYRPGQTARSVVELHGVQLKRLR